MTPREKEALLRRIYALPTEWADEGGSYGKGGPVGSDDAAMLWPEDVIDAINQFAEDNNVPVKQPDPETGLVPCGCGGKAGVYNPDGMTDVYVIKCEKCRVCILYALDLSKAIAEWNSAMGYKEDA